MTISFTYTINAQRMIDRIDEWWSEEHGFSMPNPLLREIHEAVERLRQTPRLGILVRGHRHVRRLLMPVGWHLYYRYQADQQRIDIVAVWYAKRGRPPPL